MAPSGPPGSSELPGPPPEWLILESNIVFLLLGLYGWEYILSFDIEQAIICRRSSFRWSMIPYILGRVTLLMYLIIFAISTSPFVHLSCQPSTLLSLIALQTAIACASTIFMIRAWVIWFDSLSVHILLLLATLLHWSLLVARVVFVKSIRIGEICARYLNNPEFGIATMDYTVTYDLLVLVLLVVGLSRQRSECTLTKRLHSQGISYFIIVMLTFIPVIVCMRLNFTPLVIIFTSAMATVNTVVASKAVRSLLDLDPTTAAQRSENTDIQLTTQIAMWSSGPQRRFSGRQPGFNELNSDC